MSDQKFQIHLTKFETYSQISISGSIDENSDFQNFFKLEFHHELRLELANVHFVNSMGLKNWYNWIKTVRAPVIAFYNCQRCMVEQLNILRGPSKRQSLIQSFYVPYHCESCDHEDSYLATRGVDYHEATSDQKAINRIPSEIPCQSCSQRMEIDVLPQKYFFFL